MRGLRCCSESVDHPELKLDVIALFSSHVLCEFGVEALNEAIHRFGPPEIMNTDQGSQFTGEPPLVVRFECYTNGPLV